MGVDQPPPQLTMGATPKNLIIAEVVSTICYIADQCGYELDEIRPIFSTLQLLHVQCTSTLCIYNYTLYLARFVHVGPEGMFDT